MKSPQKQKQNERGSIEIWMQVGRKVEMWRIRARLVGDHLAVHKSAPLSSSFTVSHAATGLWIVNKPNEAAALAWAKRVQNNPVFDTLTRLAPELKGAIRQIFELRLEL